MMESAAALSSGKGARDENFPVASFLIHKRHRPVILAFYRFARAADDVADHPAATAAEKLHLLENMWRSLHGEADLSPEATALCRVLDERKLSPQHALHLLEAFRRDVTKLRYANWDELIDYCRYSAMPVGRFVLDVHGESRLAWPASDALCSALQIINHLQDCGRDYRDLDRVYIPLDILDKHGADPAALAAGTSSRPLRKIIAELAGRNVTLLVQSRAFSHQIMDHRLAWEVRLIQRLAENLNRRLITHDPLRDRVHHHSLETAGLTLLASLEFMATRRRAKAHRLGLSRQRPKSLHGH
jgi:squalene synthase HpnC